MFKHSWGIIGGGILGMTLAHRLAREGQRVTLFERAGQVGGLAAAWTLGDVVWDRHYHVILQSDTHLGALLAELGLDGEVRWAQTRTGFYTEGRLFSLSNSLEFLRFPPLGMIDKLRLAATIVYASKIKDWKRLERVGVVEWLQRYSGRRTVEKIWLPLLRAKLGEHYRYTSAAFIWAVIARMYAARQSGMKTERFGYVRGGYARILGRLEERLQADGVRIEVGRAATVVEAAGMSRVRIAFENGAQEVFDRAVVTVAAPLAARLCRGLSEDERARLAGVRYQGIVCASLLLKRPLAGFYVTNITEGWVPFTAVIEMSTLVDRAQFGGRTLIYLPKYVTPGDPTFAMTDEQVRAEWTAALVRMYPGFRKEDVTCFRVSRVRYVLPISTLGYSDRLPPMTTSVPGLSIVNSAHIVNGTLNVNETVQLADRAMPHLLSPVTDSSRSGTEIDSDRRKPTASLSLDLDNHWSYLKTHGDPGWESFPTYLEVVVPRVLSLLKKWHLTITVFVVGQDAALAKNHEMLAAVASAGHEIGSHSFRHEPWLHRYSESEVDVELARAEDSIERVTGRRPRGFRGPGFSLSSATLRVLVRRGYQYDASTFPTFIGPLARAYYFRTVRLSQEDREARAALFGSFRDGFRPLRPYRWNIDGSTLCEIPVTTMPLVRLPIHVSYVLYLATVSPRAAMHYFALALRLCRLTRIQPSLLLHPLDVLGREDLSSLSFFPAMNMSVKRKLELVDAVLERLTTTFAVLTVQRHAEAASRTRLPLVAPRFDHDRVRR